MGDSAIQWTTKTWNPTVGCMKVSPGCERCYAMRLTPRLAAMGQTDYAGLTKRLPDGSVNWTGEVRMLPDRLAIPLGWKKPARIFVDSMSDLFHEDVPYEFVESVFRIMALCPQHTFQILTKRPHRMREFALNRHVGTYRDHVLPNVWLGVSVENQQAADERIPLLLQTPAAVRFLSCEPLIGPLKLSEYLRPVCPSHEAEADIVECAHAGWDHMTQRRPRVAWLIVGGESGPGARPFNIDWARSLTIQCRFAGVAPFVKQLGAKPRNSVGKALEGFTDGGHHGDMDEWPAELRVREFPEPRRELAHA